MVVSSTLNVTRTRSTTPRLTKGFRSIKNPPHSPRFGRRTGDRELPEVTETGKISICEQERVGRQAMCVREFGGRRVRRRRIRRAAGVAVIMHAAKQGNSESGIEVRCSLRRAGKELERAPTAKLGVDWRDPLAPAQRLFGATIEPFHRTRAIAAKLHQAQRLDTRPIIVANFAHHRRRSGGLPVASYAPAR